MSYLGNLGKMNLADSCSMKNRCVLGFHVYTNMALSPIFHLKNITSIYMKINLESLLLKQGPKITNLLKPTTQACLKNTSDPGLSLLGSDHDGRIGSIHAATKAGISLSMGAPQKSLVFRNVLIGKKGILIIAACFNPYITG